MNIPELKVCDYVYKNNWTYSVVVIEGIACCAECYYPLKFHKRDITVKTNRAYKFRIPTTR